jgi:hypothetical protein
MSGKHYNGSVRSHKVVYEALMRLLFEQYLDSLSEDKRDETITMSGKCLEEFNPGINFTMADIPNFE